jgi:hypothetical protein
MTSGLYPRDLDALVGLYMRTQTDIVALGDLADAVSVFLHTSDIEK